MSSAVASSLLFWRGHPFIALAVRLYLGWLFLVACWHKIAHPESFALDVATYQLLPLYVVNLFALVMPWLELLVGLLLVVGYRVRATALLVVLLMLSFIVALLWALHLGLDMSCGCFASQAASSDDAISWRTLLRDLTWLALGLYVLGFDRNSIGIQRMIRRKAS
jgi:putative oxidoreductase